MFFYKNVSISKKIFDLKIVPTTTTPTTSTVPWSGLLRRQKLLIYAGSPHCSDCFLKNKNLGHPEILLGGSGQN